MDCIFMKQDGGKSVVPEKVEMRGMMNGSRMVKCLIKHIGADEGELIMILLILAILYDPNFMTLFKGCPISKPGQYINTTSIIHCRCFPRSPMTGAPSCVINRKLIEISIGATAAIFCAARGAKEENHPKDDRDESCDTPGGLKI